MIPASFLYKDAFRQKWGPELERCDNLIPDSPVVGAQWPSPSAFQAARDLFGLAFGRHRERR